MQNLRGTNQSIARKKNQKIVLNMFKHKSLFTSEIAEILNLSNSGTKNIIDELIHSGILIETTSPRQISSGRCPITLTLNPNHGIIPVIDFFNKKILITDLQGKILFSESLQFNDKITNSNIHGISDILYSILKQSDFINKKLLCLAVVFVGKINPKTCEIIHSYMFSDCSINLKAFFTEKFKCDFIIKNNIHFEVIAEKEFGALKGITTPSCYLSIGAGITSTYIIENKIYYGAYGYAGELGLTCVDFKNPSLPLTNYADMKFINTEIVKLMTQGASILESFDINEALPTRQNIIDSYNKGHKDIEIIVNTSAYYIGIALKNLIDIMDFDTIVLNGSLTEFGDKYIQVIKDTLYKYSHSSPKIVKSEILNDAIFMGVLDNTRNHVFDSLITSIRPND